MTTRRTKRFLRPARLGAALLSLIVCTFAAPAHSHHSASMFDRGKARVIEGVVSEFQWTNPHAWLQVDVRDESGATVQWSVEMGGINSLARSGYRPSTFKPGDKVAVHVAPLADGGPAGLFIGARLPDGKELGSMP